MISAFTRKIATPVPFTSPIPRPTPSATRIATTVPSRAKLEIMNADAVAVVATERSTPPVSMTSVWPAAISPRIAAYRNVVETWRPVMNASLDCARFTMSVATNSAIKTNVSTIAGFRSEEHTSELQSHRDLHSFPTRRSSDLNLAPGDERLTRLRAVHDVRRDEQRDKDEREHNRRV